MCVGRVKNALQQVDGVVKVNVKVGKKTIGVAVNEKAAITGDMLINALKPTDCNATEL